MIKIKHNLDSDKFKWLWCKYVQDINDKKHCTNSLRGKYGKKFSKHNENFNKKTTIVFDEQPEDSFKAIYICGVANSGYASKKNYLHNLHIAIISEKGTRCLFQSEKWQIEIEDGIISRIPEIEELPLKYQGLSEEYITCRIFRWAVGAFHCPKNI